MRVLPPARYTVGLLSPPISALPYGLVVRIPAFHAGGPGSIPGVGSGFAFSSSIDEGLWNNKMQLNMKLSPQDIDLYETQYDQVILL